MIPPSDPKQRSILEFTYQLPEEKIARYPSAQRDDSKLLIYRTGQISEDIFANLPRYLAEGSLLVFNNTKVVEARVLFQKPTGGWVELFCLEPHEQQVDLALAQTQRVRWNCLIGGASKWKKGQILQKQVAVDQGVFTLQAKYLEKRAGDFVIEFSWEPQTLHFADVLHLTGQIPLPPYLKRDAEPQDKDRYQTIYAALDGSVAAPTAGLHFTPRIFERLAALGIQWDFVTLHVGAGTFKPVKSDSLAQHVMHEEYLEVSRTTIRRLREQNGRPLLAVGTTALRTLESLYWLGLKVMSEPAMDPRELTIQQWDAYTHPAVQVAASESLDALELWLVKQGVEKIWTKTALLIAPGYEFKLVDGLITNFHQPESTLLLLVAAFLGQDWTRVYKYALENQFRFLSYGDGSLLFRPSSAPS